MRVTVVDYGAGNVVSVLKALLHLGADARLSAEPRVVRLADIVVFPGQGHFGQAMAHLRRSGMDDALREVVAAGRPFLGICLGLQLLLSASDEAPGVGGLDLLPGRCKRLAGTVKVPQIGWNRIRPGPADSPLRVLKPADAAGFYYFVHSFYAVCDEPSDVAATAEHGIPFCAAVARGNLFATQFHPEKSGRAGLALLRAFLRRARLASDGVASERVTNDGVTGERVTGERVTGERVTGERVTGERVTSESVTSESVTGEGAKR